MDDAEISALPPLLAMAAAVRERKDGTLRMQSDKITRQITFKGGAVVSALSNARSETAGGFLLKKGRLTEAQVTQFVAMLKDGKTNPWTAASKLAQLSPDQDDLLWKEYVGFIAGTAVTAPKVEAKFQTAPSPAVSRQIPGIRFLLSVAYALPPELGRRLVSALTPESFVFLEEKIIAAQEPLPLDPEEKGLLTVVKTNSVVAEVYSSSFLAPDKIYSLLLTYTLAGLLRVESAEELTRKKFFVSLGPSEKSLREEVLSFHDRLDRSTYYDWLGVTPRSTPDQIHAEWNKKINRYSSLSPEKFLLPTENSKHETVTQKLTEARTVLSNSSKREEYDRYLASGGTGSFVDQSVTVREEEWLRKGAALESDGNFSDAFARYEEGMKTLSESSRLAAAFARMALKVKGATDVATRDRVIQELRRVVALPTSGGEAYEALAIWLHEMAQTDKAVAAARKALSFSPYSRVTWDLMEKIDPTHATEWILSGLQTYQGKTDFYQLLGIDRNVSAAVVQQAYRTCTKRFHPDRFFDVTDPALKDVAKEVYKRMIDAYVTLKHPEKRNKYDEQLALAASQPAEKTIAPGAAAPTPTVATGNAPKTAQGQRFYKLALDALRHGNVDSAKLNLQFGLQLEPTCQALKEKLAELTRR